MQVLIFISSFLLYLNRSMKINYTKIRKDTTKYCDMFFKRNIKFKPKYTKERKDMTRLVM